MSKPFYPTVEILDCKSFAEPKHSKIAPNLRTLVIGEAHVIIRGERKYIEIIQILGYPTVCIKHLDKTDLQTLLHIQLAVLSRFKHEIEQANRLSPDSF